MKTYAMMILGCKVNDYEAHALKEELDQDYKEVPFKEKADIYLIFSCCVTNIAAAKTRKFIHAAKRKNPAAYLVVVGCYAQIEKNKQYFDGVDLLIGSQDKNRIKEYLDKAVKADLVRALTAPTFEYLPIKHYKDKARAFLKVQDGCNQFCSYCIIPYARGRERSAKLEYLIREAELLAESTPEIVLTGIHTGRYFDGEYHLADLLAALLKIDNLATIRLSSIEITEINAQIITLMKAHNKLAHHLHIPLQSGADAVLKAMGRPYDRAYYEQRVKEIRAQIPDIAISADLIVGFPGETAALFAETLAFLKQIKFNFIHVFPYSAKEGTKAAGFTGQISAEEKKRRVHIVEELAETIKLEIWETYLGRNFTVLIERNDGNYSYGYARQYLPFKVRGVFKTGSLVRVKALCFDKAHLEGVNDVS